MRINVPQHSLRVWFNPSLRSPRLRGSCPGPAARAGFLNSLFPAEPDPSHPIVPSGDLPGGFPCARAVGEMHGSSPVWAGLNLPTHPRIIASASRKTPERSWE